MSIFTRKFVIIALAIVLLISSTILLNIEPAMQTGVPALPPGFGTPEEQPPSEPDDEPEQEIDFDDLQLAFSHPEHFYETDIAVSIFASIPGATIYYTLDGSDPTVESEVYTEPLPMKASATTKLNTVSLKAIAEYEDIITRPLVHTYFLGVYVKERFDTLVISLSTDPDNLYDYDIGIFEEGRTRAEYIQENPRERINPPSPANFNWRGMEGERPVYVETFLPSGERVVAQAAGMRVHGGWSRAASQKSIRLIARNMYEPEQGKFHFDFFPDDMIDEELGISLGKYDQLILRNGANDRDFGMLRNEAGSVLARMAGLRTSPSVRAVSIFINGEYYGFAWLQTRVNAQYLQDIYSSPTRNFQIFGKGEYWIDSDDPEDREAFEEINSFFDRNLRDDKVFAEFEALIDVDNLMVYYALQTYLGNHDWPNNNIRRWRYTGPQEDGLAPELDGRWRYIVFDLDWWFGLYEDNPNINRPTFEEMMNRRNDRYSPMLKALFARDDMVDKFAIAMCDVVSNIATEQNIKRIVDELYAEMRNELGYAFDAGKYAHWVSHDTVRFNHSNMQYVARGRPDYIYNVMRNHFNWDDGMFTVEVTGDSAYIGTQIGTSSLYFDHLTIPLRPVLQGYYVFDHWILNGEEIYTPEIFVSLEDAVDGVVRVELVTREELPVLMFKEAHGSSESNGCVLYNPGQEEVHTEGLYLTNDLENPFRWALPGARVAPGGTLEFAGRGSRDPDDLHKIRMGFNARSGRILFLCNADGEVISHIAVS